MSHVHVCRFCGCRYPATTLTSEVNDHGDIACDCPKQDECPECADETPANG